MKEKINKILNNKFVRFIFGIIKVAIWVVVLLVVGMIIIQRAFDNKVSIGSYRMFTVVSGSMLPDYQIYDVIISKETEPSRLKIGDDIVYLGKEGDFEDKVVTHRIIDIINDNENYKFKTQGIANNTADPIVNSDQLYGKVVYRPAVLSYIIKVLNSTYGFYFLVFVPIVFLIFLEILDTIKRREEKLDEEDNYEGETK